MRSYLSTTYFGALSAFGAIVLIAGLSLRLTLFIVYGDSFDWRFLSLFEALFLGVANDLFAFGYIALVPISLILLFGDRFYYEKLGKIYLYSLIAVFSFLIALCAAVEYLFWGAYYSRFNFIAVDYALNDFALDKSPVGLWATVAILTIAVVLSLLFVLGAKKFVIPRELSGFLSRDRTRLALFWIHAVIAVLIFLFYSPFASVESRVFGELSRNGIYEFFSAYRAKSIDYYTFYPALAKTEARSIAINEIKSGDDRFLSNGSKDFLKITAPKQHEISPNVVVVVASGIDKRLLDKFAPNINSYIEGGLSFSRIYATGAGSLRAIEAFSLSIPAIAGDSIIKRSRKPIFSLSDIFASRAYAREFIYGGYGYYDNLNAFFSLNGYEVIDRNAFATDNKTFASGGKQSDEDLFTEALDRADMNYLGNRRFFQLLLSSSISVPYNYPRGRIEIAPKTSREGATRYFDYALGRYIDAARAKPWFDDTIFVILSDGASSGAFNLARYETIAVFYAPKIITPRQIDVLCSQIDIAPTLLGLLGWGYESRFFGRDMLNAAGGRAFVATNTRLAFAASNGDFVVLRPARSADLTNASRRRAAAIYQSAFDLFNEGRLNKENAKTPHF
ncbi:MAG: sulfatase-like hydrolase/transferase [Helicobacteraceae bacterium]|jgi:phosphoglycerol transferase MdoB-like AlkP superfamily enzyme|nr:sulfatase-like hydrolase/transferase [Helicobacteraceae bacterium]